MVTIVSNLAGFFVWKCYALLLIFFRLHSHAEVYNGVRMGDFPPPDFKTTIKAVAAQNGDDSFQRVSLPSSFKSVPDLVRVFASTEDGDSSGFRFEGTGACQNSGSSGNYGGVIFAYNVNEVYLWAPTRYSGNTNGKLIYVEDGWGGEKFTQSSRIADLTITAWHSLPTPNFHATIQVDKSRRYFEVPHKLKQIPDFISVRVYSKSSYAFKKDFSFHFHAAGAVQTPSGNIEYGGVVFAYNETLVRLWLPNVGGSLKTGCILLTKGWGNGKYSSQLNADVCQVEIRAWINSFPLPAFQTGWASIRANAHKKSFREIRHGIGKETLLVQVQVKKQGSRTNHFIYDGLGSIQSTQSALGTYGGVVFAYDTEMIRIWVASSEIGEKGRAIFISDQWGNGTQAEEHDNALFRIRIYAHVCKSKMQIADAQGVCRDAGQLGLVWQATPWGNCSSVCSKGIQQKNLAACHAVNVRTAFSCNFERDECGFSSSHKWRLSRGAAEKELEPDGFAQPPRGFRRNDQFIYSVVKNLPGGSYVQLTSPTFTPRKNCNLKFLYNTGVYYHIIEVSVLSRGNWHLAWSLSDKQPGDPYIWHHGYLNLENYDVAGFKFALRLRQKCLKHCGYVAFDDVTLQCEAEEKTQVPLEKCERRTTPLPGCGINVLQPVHKGKAFSIVTSNSGKLVRANSTLSEHIATYRFRVEKSADYIVWIEVLGTSLRDNSVSLYIDQYRQKTVHSVIRSAQPAWTWNYLDQKGYRLAPGIHTITLMQYDLGFTYRTIIVSPRHVAAWAPLGLQSMTINDLQLSVSLNIKPESVPYIRLNGKGAWETDDINFGWLHWQVNFPDVALVSRVAIQGACRVANRPCCSAESFKLKFSIDGKDFSHYRNSSHFEQMFPGSSRTAPNHVVISELDYAVPARAIQFYPYNSVSVTCIRVEVYGAYITKEMCAHTGLKPDLVRSCVGSRDCGKNAECARVSHRKESKESCKCAAGFHGQNCEHVGCTPNPCQNNGVCKLLNSTFKCTCQPGFTGNLCQMPCPSNKFGVGCNETCYCFGKSRCHPVTGECICEPGFVGQLCDTPCASGYYGHNCDSVCRCSSLTVCDQRTGSCYCPTGFYGQFCENRCKIGFYGRNCSTPCQCARHSKCLPSNGTCICPPGWFGALCDKECPNGKFGTNCQFNCMCRGHSKCNRRDGSCACKSGWKGEQCDVPCGKKAYGIGCINCSCLWDTADRCDSVTGKCICKNGFSGPLCQNRCKHGRYGSGCTRQCKCKNNAYCDPENGHCRCRDGFIGRLCQTPCPKERYGENCNSFCRCIANHTQSCDNVDGTCDCLPGFKGKKCHKICKKGFWGKNCDFECHCHHGSECDRMDGLCLCTAGWVGATCDAPCDFGYYGPGCKFPCQCKNDATCSRFNGSCTCSLGFIGTFCGQKCPQWSYGQNCEGDCACRRDFASGCSNVNGTCFCKAGYHGEKCEKDCQDGKYGPNCKLDCPLCLHHSTGSCDKVTGSCNCSPGFYGDLCQYYCPLEKFGYLCSSQCQCTDSEICNNINGDCFSRSHFEFFMSLQFGSNDVVSSNVFTRFATNFDKLMAKYFIDFLRPVVLRKRDVEEQEVFLRTAAGVERSGESLIRLDTMINEEEMEARKISTIDREVLVDSVLNENLAGNGERGNHISHKNRLDADPNEEMDRNRGKIEMRKSRSNSVHDVTRRDLTNSSQGLNCVALSSPSEVNSFSVRVTSKTKKFAENGRLVMKLGLVALYKGRPQEKQVMKKFLQVLPDECLLYGANCDLCSVYIGKLYDKKPDEGSINIWIIIGATLAGLAVFTTLAVYLIVQRKRHSIVPTIYKVKKNSRDIELRPCLANGDGSHVLAFENPYYDVIAAMGLDDDIEEDYYNPLYTYDDVSLYCDDQASDSGTETNNEDGYQYPYDRDSGISSGTIHQ